MQREYPADGARRCPIKGPERKARRQEGAQRFAFSSLLFRRFTRQARGGLLLKRKMAPVHFGLRRKGIAARLLTLCRMRHAFVAGAFFRGDAAAHEKARGRGKEPRACRSEPAGRGAPVARAGEEGRPEVGAGREGAGKTLKPFFRKGTPHAPFFGIISGRSRDACRRDACRSRRHDDGNRDRLRSCGSRGRADRPFPSY